MTEKCTNIIEATGKICGSDELGTAFHTRFCSTECEDRVNAAELAELGITPTMMKEAVNTYYQVKDEIDQKLDAEAREETASPNLAQSTPPPQAPS